ncbi:hypothetical protein M422DRAFT_26663 [Sphaerobolus stellatus SS14]|nr:hypothetical protein M422DRAFT_26663 [Sphaerobolus stellatus SS14]
MTILTIHDLVQARLIIERFTQEYLVTPNPYPLHPIPAPAASDLPLYTHTLHHLHTTSLQLSSTSDLTLPLFHALFQDDSATRRIVDIICTIAVNTPYTQHTLTHHNTYLFALQTIQSYVAEIDAMQNRLRVLLGSFGEQQQQEVAWLLAYFPSDSSSGDSSSIHGSADGPTRDGGGTTSGIGIGMEEEAGNASGMEEEADVVGLVGYGRGGRWGGSLRDEMDELTMRMQTVWV